MFRSVFRRSPLRDSRRGVIMAQMMKIGAFGAIGGGAIANMDEIGDALEAPYEMGIGMAATIELRQIYNGLVGRVAAGGQLVTHEQFQPWVRQEFTRPDGTDPSYDPWHHAYGYIMNPHPARFRLACQGRDGVWGQDYTALEVDENMIGDDIFFTWQEPGAL